MPVLDSPLYSYANKDKKASHQEITPVRRTKTSNTLVLYQDKAGRGTALDNAALVISVQYMLPTLLTV